MGGGGGIPNIVHSHYQHQYQYLDIQDNMCGRFTSISLFPQFSFYLLFTPLLPLHSSICIKFHFKSYYRLPCKYSLLRKKDTYGNQFVGKRKFFFSWFGLLHDIKKLRRIGKSVDQGIFLQLYNMKMKWDMIWQSQNEKWEIIMSRILFFNTYCSVRAEHEFLFST